jgi:hypothetical protein
VLRPVDGMADMDAVTRQIEAVLATGAGGRDAQGGVGRR